MAISPQGLGHVLRRIPKRGLIVVQPAVPDGFRGPALVAELPSGRYGVKRIHSGNYHSSGLPGGCDSNGDFTQACRFCGDYYTTTPCYQHIMSCYQQRKIKVVWPLVSG